MRGLGPTAGGDGVVERRLDTGADVAREERGRAVGDVGDLRECASRRRYACDRHDTVDELDVGGRGFEQVLDALSGRDPADVTLVAVSKTVPAERLVAAVAAGLTTLGENRVQEAEGKVGAVAS